MNKWVIRGFTALSAGLVGTYLIMSEGKRRRAQAAAEEAKKNAKWKRGQQKGEPEQGWTEKVKQAGEKVTQNVGDTVKNVGDTVKSENLTDRLRNLSSWVEGPGSPNYERTTQEPEDEDSKEDEG